MAALKNNGIELVRMVRVLPDSDNLPVRRTLSIRSNGVILSKLEVTIDGSFHSYGWKRLCRYLSVTEEIKRYAKQGFGVLSVSADIPSLNGIASNMSKPLKSIGNSDF
jgi:hypothetical protein